MMPEAECWTSRLGGGGGVAAIVEASTRPAELNGGCVVVRWPVAIGALKPRVVLLVTLLPIKSTN